MLNKWIGIGRLTDVPAVRYTQEGTMVTNFSVACNETRKGKDGQKIDSVEYIKIVSFGKLAEICGEYLRKGSLVYVEGKIQTRSWEKDGEKRYTTEIVANTMKMLDKKHEENPPADDDTPF